MQTKRFGLTSAFLGWFLCLLGLYSTGCADWDDEVAYSSTHVGVIEASESIVVTGAWEEIEVKTTSDADCEAIENALHGRWQGTDDNAGRRITMGSDGTYRMEEEVRGWWRLIDSGRYWIDFTVYRGMMRPLLHLEMGGQDDYPVRYRVDGNVLVLEEMSETPMCFARDTAAE